VTTNQLLAEFERVLGPSNAAQIIRRHYGLSRSVTSDEVAAEIANLRRKRAAGSLDTRQEHLFAALNL
jgi:hypothetical protein